MKIKLLLTCLLFPVSPAFGQDVETATFKFVPGEDVFYIPWQGNDLELNRLYNMVDQYRTEITSGVMPVYVDGYSSSGQSAERNRELSFIRSNRVKSELITHQGLVEDHFVTRNHTADYEGAKDVVVVTLRPPVREQPVAQPAPEPVPEPVPLPEPAPQPEPVAQPQPQPVVEPVAQPIRRGCDPYCFAVRTNLLYDAFLLPTLGVEWRVNRCVGLKLDGSFSHWGDERGKVQKIWMLSPEVRWYMGGGRYFYLGAGANYNEYNVFDYLIGGALADDTGYQGTLWSAGVTVGYQLYLSRTFSLDFNAGLGYLESRYDSFWMVDGVRVYRDKDVTKQSWGPTQAGISLVWKIGAFK